MSSSEKIDRTMGMTIGFDGKRAVSNMTGLGNYSRLVIESLARHDRNDRMLIYTPSLRDNPRLRQIVSMPNTEFRTPATGGITGKGSLWRTFGMTHQIRNDAPDLFHGLSNELPFNMANSGIPSVVTIHDVIYRRLPHCYSAIDRKLYDIKYGRSCRIADRIIAVSECTKRDVMHYYGIGEEKIDVVYQGCDDSFKTPAPQPQMERIRAEYHLPERYILQVGSVEERKNLELTIRALTAVPSDVCLVVVGKGGGYRQKMRNLATELRVADRIIWIEGIPFSDLPALNRMAEVIVYPSRYEGFGIPILEGLESERPVIAATGSCLEEAGGPGSIYVSPDSPQELTEALNAVISGSADIPRMIAEGKRHAARFDNSQMATLLHEVYNRTINGFENPLQ